MYCYHVKSLHSKNFTKVNSDKKKIEEDEEDENGKGKKKSKKQLARDINNIVDGKTTMHCNKHRISNSVLPIHPRESLHF